ncbi:CDP-alcohol phosphatidyltransferase family protein [Conchiformibius steedae DSM 2580]|uniref:CDP-alcohol phosphatidyltransferase family protein n=1 Tax=Conchiformibius steedae DSM 2580 TaxID=1121352 RepID=A0AAE9HTQ3_9NEIS|nr:CDP-alcohol phosphatidyltransferase family protein [Conchiformibius steedae]URD67459.1 CDP-alcohol phosphatidyltransferase family protein [Conchiformibius steedae DSM 2580]
MILTSHYLKPQLRQWLKAPAQALVNRGISANQLTWAAAGGSLVVGLLLALLHQTAWLFWLLPVWLLLRLALDVLDGLMAQDFMQESAEGAYWAEAGALAADAALWLPMTWLAGAFPVGVLIWLGAVCESVGLLGKVHGFHGRREDGPMARGDRMVVLAVLAVWYAVAGNLNWAAQLLVWLAVAATAYTCWVRMQNGLRGYGAAQTAAVTDDNDNE